MKQCTKCKEIKDLVDFYTDKSRKDGFGSYCKSCRRAASSMWIKQNPEKHRKSRAHWVKNNKEKVSISNSLYRTKNREIINLRVSKWYKENTEKAKNKAKKWKELNRDKVNFYDSKRRAAKLNAVPKWLSKQQWFEIKSIYIARKEIVEQTGIQHHVDHIIPLQGENVSGLHVPWNLQILTAKNNLRKSRKVTGL